MNLWLVMVGMGVVTVVIRLSFFVFLPHEALPPLARRSLRYVAPAVLTAIIVPAVLYLDGSGAFEPWPSNERVPAALIATAVAAFTANVWATIAAGMTALWLLQWLT